MYVIKELNLKGDMISKKKFNCDIENKCLFNKTMWYKRLILSAKPHCCPWRPQSDTGLKIWLLQE